MYFDVTEETKIMFEQKGVELRMTSAHREEYYEETNDFGEDGSDKRIRNIKTNMFTE